MEEMWYPLKGESEDRVAMYSKPAIVSLYETDEIPTSECCQIIQAVGLPEEGCFSIARARVKPGKTTAWHLLEGITEIYLIFSGQGMVEIGELPPERIKPGQVVIIPPGTRQRIKALGKNDLVFFCVCSPSFKPNCYRSLE
jgi:mannose-6-phosphate isomerase-like protein (cupin superfamily)